MMIREVEEDCATISDIIEISSNVHVKIAILCDDYQYMMFVETCRSFFTAFIHALVRKSAGLPLRGIDMEMLDAVNFDENCKSALALRLDTTVIFVRFLPRKRRFQVYDAEFLDCE